MTLLKKIKRINKQYILEQYVPTVHEYEVVELNLDLLENEGLIFKQDMDDVISLYRLKNKDDVVVELFTSMDALVEYINTFEFKKFV